MWSETSRWITRSARSSTQPSTLASAEWTESQVTEATARESLTVSMALWATVATLAELVLESVRMLRPSGVRTHTARGKVGEGDPLAPGEPLAEGRGDDLVGVEPPQAAARSRAAARAGQIRVRIIASPCGAILEPTTLGRHPSRRSRHPHAFEAAQGAAPGGRAPDRRPRGRSLPRGRHPAPLCGGQPQPARGRRAP